MARRVACARARPLNSPGRSRKAEAALPGHRLRWWLGLAASGAFGAIESRQSRALAATILPRVDQELTNYQLEESSYDITASTRRDGHAEKLRHLGCQVLQASLDDADAITKAVADSDIIINTASSDHPGSVESTLKGIRERSSAGKKTIYMCACDRASAS